MPISASRRVLERLADEVLTELEQFELRADDEVSVVPIPDEADAV
jgi:hypothetical protein